MLDGQAITSIAGTIDQMSVLLKLRNKIYTQRDLNSISRIKIKNLALIPPFFPNSVHKQTKNRLTLMASGPSLRNAPKGIRTIESYLRVSTGLLS